MSTKTADPRRSEGSLQSATARIHEVSSIPHVVAQILEVVNDDKASVADLRRVVESDPSLATRVLRTVNSAAYGLRGPVETIHRAICYLGFHEVRNLAISASIADMFENEQQIRAYSRTGLWRHLVSVGIASRMVGRRCGLGNLEEAFLAGLLHDLGIILMDQHLHKSFVDVVEALSPEKTLCTVERERLGFDHAQLGSAVAEKWRFPAGVSAAIRFHHDSHLCRGENRALAQTVELANYLCTEQGISSTGVSNVPRPREAVFETLSLDQDGFDRLCEELDSELEKNSELLTI